MTWTLKKVRGTDFHPAQAVRGCSGARFFFLQSCPLDEGMRAERKIFHVN